MSKKGKPDARPPVWVSQNFLTSGKIIQRLLGKTSLNKKDHVIEIGPGKGHTTNALSQKCRRVSAVELDAGLYARLKEKFAGTENIALYHQDFLKWKLPIQGSYKVFANIPFGITSAIVRKLTEGKNPPLEAWLTMEKGAAKRFIGKPRETLSSLSLKPWFDSDIVYYFHREDFHPMPSVEVVLLHLKRKEQPDIPPYHRQAYERFISQCMRNDIGAMERLFTKKQLAKAMRAAGLPADFTPAGLLYVQWLCLFRCYLHCKQ